MRLGTWNILAGHSVTEDVEDTIGAAVARLDLDVLGLNEVDYRQERSGFTDQTREAAAAMGAVDWRFGPSFRGEDRSRVSMRGTLFGPDDRPSGSHYGISLLSRVPVLRWHRTELGMSPIGLPLLSARHGERSMRYVVDEPHLAIGAELANGWVVVATHLSFVTPVAVAQLVRVRAWARRLGRKAGKRVAVIGDMNLARVIIPLRPQWQSPINANTYPSWQPSVQLDHILVPLGVEATPLTLPSVGLSDHLPIAVDVH